MDDDGSTWTLYDAGPRSVRCPLLFLPPVSGRADIFFRQLLALSGLGYRVIAVCILFFFFLDLHFVSLESKSVHHFT